MKYAGVAELADATDLKSVGEKSPYRFDSGPRHHVNANRYFEVDLPNIVLIDKNLVNKRIG